MPRFLTALLIAFTLMTLGCGDSKSDGLVAEDKLLEASVKEFGDLYLHFQAQQKRPPKNAQELTRLYGPAFPSGETLPGNPDWVISWGATIPGNNPSSVLAYSKNHKDGDPVLQADGQLKKMTKAELDSAPKADK